MRQAIGGTWILQLVIIFMLIFVGFLALTINYTKAFKVKNELVTIIEKYEGVTSGDNGSVALINNYLRHNGYSIKGSCESGYYGVASLDSTSLTPVSDNNKYYYCVRKVNTKSGTFHNRAGYEIVTFFKFNIPFLGDLFTFRVEGDTIDIASPSDEIPAILE